MLHFFECGRLAIGVCVSHKLVDVPTLGTFIKASKCAETYKIYTMVSHSVNICKRVVPPLPPTSVGNLVGYYAAMVEESGNELKELDIRNIMSGDDINFFICTTACTFEMYEIDFGW
ncbi:unnamed protein product [Prunus brigantina]